MTFPFPPDIADGAIIDGSQFGSSDTVWAITFPPTNSNRQLSRIALIAPSGIAPTTRLIVWMDTTMISVAPSGVATEYEPYRPIAFGSGRVLYVVWYSNAAGTPPKGTLFTEGSYL